jgi:hypothetical protein
MNDKKTIIISPYCATYLYVDLGEWPEILYDKIRGKAAFAFSSEKAKDSINRFFDDAPIGVKTFTDKYREIRAAMYAVKGNGGE